MHVKRFEAETLDAALSQVREALGPDALILSTRTLKSGRGRFGLLGRPRVEVQAALERAEDRPRAATDEATLYEPTGLPRAAAETLRFERELREELHAIRSAIARLEAAPSGQGATLPADLGPLERRLVRGVDRGTAEALVEQWRVEAADGATLGDVVRRRLEANCAPPRAADGRRLRVLVGAAGAGKTTSLAKLAARNEEGERDVTLASLDGERVGATEGLRRYAELLDSPFVALERADDVPKLLSRGFLGEVLVDTAGRDPAAGDGGLAAVRERMGRRMQVELVLDATARPEVRRAQVARFAALSPDRVILTRCDELPDAASAASLVLEAPGAPVTWLGTGQRVPEDFRVADPETLWRALAGEAA